MNEKLEHWQVLLDGKFLLSDELPLSKSERELLLREKKLRKTPAIKRLAFRSECQRCHNRSPKHFAKIPCERCQQTHLYCRQCIQMGRVLACDHLYEWSGQGFNWPKHKNPCQWEGQLTPSQLMASNRLVEAILNKEKEILLWAVTGAGKTEMLFPAITKGLELGFRICIASPRVDVVRELLPRLKEAFPNISSEALYGGSEDRLGHAQLVLATTHQLLRFKQAFDLQIIDEIDAYPYTLDPSLKAATKRSVKSSGTQVYLTATPQKEEEKRIKNASLPHVFIPRRFHNHPLPVPQLINCFSLEKSLKGYHLPKSFHAWFQERQQRVRGKQLLIFLPTISMTDQVALRNKDFFEKHQLKVEAVHAEDEDRPLKVEQFRQQSIDVLFTTTILERGVTFPAIDVVVIDAGHEVFDRAALVQIAGRAGRHPKDPKGEVLFIHDGKTRAMIEAVRLIQSMNRRAGF